jgi:hypothetical protein
MLIAMVLGMFVLGIPLAGLLGVAGIDVSAWDTDAPELMLLGMAFTMSVPMVAWMRHRGHGRAPAWEMTAAMFIPSFATIALLWGGLVEDSGALPRPALAAHTRLGAARLGQGRRGVHRAGDR